MFALEETQKVEDAHVIGPHLFSIQESTNNDLWWKQENLQKNPEAPQPIAAAQQSQVQDQESKKKNRSSFGMIGQ